MTVSRRTTSTVKIYRRAGNGRCITVADVLAFADELRKCDMSMDGRVTAHKDHNTMHFIEISVQQIVEHDNEPLLAGPERTASAEKTFVDACAAEEKALVDAARQGGYDESDDEWRRSE